MIFNKNTFITISTQREKSNFMSYPKIFKQHLRTCFDSWIKNLWWLDYIGNLQNTV